jgi:hypothetical protein
MDVNTSKHSQDNDVVFEPLLARALRLLARALRKLLLRARG